MRYPIDIILKSPQFKIIASAMKAKYPFILKIIPHQQEGSPYEDMVFIDIVVDITMISKKFDCPIVSFIRYYFSKTNVDDNSTVSLSHFFADECANEMRQYGDDIKSYLKDLSKLDIVDKLDVYYSPIAFIAVRQPVKYPELFIYE